MKKFLLYSILIGFAALNIFGSCEEDQQKRNERYKKAKRYFNRYVIYENVDSSYTDITVYIGEIEGHRYKYHLYNGKNKSQMEVEHDTLNCKLCNKKK